MTKHLLLAAAFCLASLGAHAQALTVQQLATVCTAVKAYQAANEIRVTGNGTAMLSWMNQATAPAFVVWKPSVPTAQIGQAINYVAVAAMTTANLARVDSFFTLNPVSFDPARADIRTYMSDTFSGALGGQGQATRDALEALYRRSATNTEKPLATGAGSFASPGTLTFAGSASQADANWIVNPANCN